MGPRGRASKIDNHIIADYLCIVCDISILFMISIIGGVSSILASVLQHGHYNMAISKAKMYLDDLELEISLPAERPTDDDPPEAEFDFVERPSEDFFCPVTFELLLDPHQTACCGNHLSEKAVHRLQRDGKPCPMCKEPQLNTVRDKFHRRRVSGVRIYCPNKANGCEWIGEVGGGKQHCLSCPKRSWKCQHCEFVSTVDTQESHLLDCMHYPVACPNQCDVGTIPRSRVDEHLTICPLQVVPCEFSDIGCTVKMTRQELKCHVEENMQHHLLNASRLNLKMIAEKDHQLAEKDRQLAEKDKQIAELQKLLQTSLDKIQRGVDQLVGEEDQVSHRFNIV